ncbi:MAG: LPXTG cell wall anchor domain-containing protein [Pseudomonadota bacterium]
MRWIAFSSGFMATPALAHHDMVVATSLVPLFGGLAALVTAFLISRRRRKK